MTFILELIIPEIRINPPRSVISGRKSLVVEFVVSHSISIILCIRVSLVIGKLGQSCCTELKNSLPVRAWKHESGYEKGKSKSAMVIRGGIM